MIGSYYYSSPGPKVKGHIDNIKGIMMIQINKTSQPIVTKRTDFDKIHVIVERNGGQITLKEDTIKQNYGRQSHAFEVKAENIFTNMHS